MATQPDEDMPRVLAEIEVGFYPCGEGQIMVFCNQNAVCIWREKIALHPELAGAAGQQVTAATLRKLQFSVRVRASEGDGGCSD